MIKFSFSPGQLGLQFPGNILAFSIIVNEEDQINYCTIIHNDTKSNENNKGVVRLKIDNLSLSNLFLLYLFEGYMNEKQ